MPGNWIEQNGLPIAHGDYLTNVILPRNDQFPRAVIKIVRNRVSFKIARWPGHGSRLVISRQPARFTGGGGGAAGIIEENT